MSRRSTVIRMLSNLHGYRLSKLKTAEKHLAQNHILQGEYRGTKFVAKFADNNDEHALILEEMDFMKTLKHPNIIQLLGIPFLLPEHCMTIPLYRYTWTNLLSPAHTARITVPIGARLTSEIAAACGFLVQNNMVHGDIKQANVFITLAGADVHDIGPAILSDFGYCLRANDILTAGLVTNPKNYVLICGTDFQTFTGEHDSAMFFTDMYQFVTRLFFSIVGVITAFNEPTFIPQDYRVNVDGMMTTLVYPLPPLYTEITQQFAFFSRVSGNVVFPLEKTVRDRAAIRQHIKTQIQPCLVITDETRVHMLSTGVVEKVLTLMLQFPRSNRDLDHAMRTWSEIRDVCSNVSNWTTRV